MVVTAGSSAAFILAFTSLFEAGDRVALGEPGYPSYRHILKALDLVPVGLPTGPEERFQPVTRQLSGDLQGLIVASPANPTGTMLARSELAALIGAEYREVDAPDGHIWPVTQPQLLAAELSR